MTARNTENLTPHVLPFNELTQIRPPTTSY